jgi:Ca-activated chloride channel family protein
MSGEKIRDVKAAALELVDTLEATDRVTLISYSSGVSRLTTNLPANETGKATLRNHILRLGSGGSTALGPALFDAFAALTSTTSSTESRMSHVILMSDGLANVGEQRPDMIGARAAAAFRQGVSVSTMGVGLDYNEDLMTKVADQGGGRYHFIKESNAIAGILSDELKGLVATVARNVVLKFESPIGARVLKVFGYFL